MKKVKLILKICEILVLIYIGYLFYKWITPDRLYLVDFILAVKIAIYVFIGIKLCQLGEEVIK